MIKFILKKLIYGILVLFGVISLIFFLFNIKNDDPEAIARTYVGQNADKEMIQAVVTDLGLDLPLYKQYFLYINDLSPISIHSSDEKSPRYLDEEKYSGFQLFTIGGNTLMIKWPYLRRSYQNDRKVSEILWQALPGTMVLAITAILIASILGIFLGVVSAINKGTYYDSASVVFSVLGMSAPSYFMALIISWIGGYVWYEISYIPALPFICLGLGAIVGLAFNRLKTRVTLENFSYAYLIEMMLKGFGFGTVIWFVLLGLGGLFNGVFDPIVDIYLEFPGTGLEGKGSLYESDDFGEESLSLANLILPAITLGIRPLAIVMQLTRSSLLEVMSQDYIRTAKAKGLSQFQVIIRHAMKNTLTPVITAISGWFASLLAGAIFVEQIFNWDGLGLKIYNAIIQDDMPTVMGSVILISAFFVIINIIVDVIYAFLDPRIRLR
ncbi:MAG: ABC transporter permease [Crocinitomicaceae bacterium]